MNSNEKRDRLVEAAAAILNAAPHNRLNIVVLNKVLFYLDLASLRDHAQTITGNSYIAIKQGPVVAKYPQRLINELENRGIARQVSQWDGSKPVILAEPLQHFNYLDADAKGLLATVTSFFSDGTSRQASNYSHDNPGWVIAWNDFQRTGKPCAINLRIAMQQIVEDDPWLNIPLLNDEEILAAADAGIGDEW